MKRIPRDQILSLMKPHVDQFPLVEETMCIEVRVPADLAYVYLLQGFVAQMTNYWAYQGPVADRKARAEIMNRAYTETDWGPCMNCEGVQDCIENNQGVRDAITALLQQNSQFPPDFPYGENLPDSETTRNLAQGTNPDCNYNVLWAQCLGIVMATNDAITDVLEKVEVSSNVVEFASAAISSIPLVAGAKLIAGIDGVVDMINYYQEAVLEGYAAQYTTTPGGVQDQLACAIFCACADDCTITIDKVLDVLSERLSVYTAPPSLEGFVNFIETLAGINQDTTFVVDLAFFVAWGAIKVGNYFFGQAYNRILDVIIALKADEPSNDWEILCDCPEIWTYTLNSATLPAWVTFPPPSWGSIAGETITFTTAEAFGQDVTGIYFEIEFPTVQSMRGLKIHQAAGTGIEGASVVNHFAAMLDTGGGNLWDSDLPQQNGEWDMDFGVTVNGVKKIVVQYLYIDQPTAGNWSEVKLTGFGTNPFLP